MKRRHFLAASAAILLPVSALAAGDVIEVYKSATCGCCGDWIKHLRASGFEVRAHDVAETEEYRARYGVPEQYASCHTATVAGYAIEGHVPPKDIKRLLAERPKAQGLAVPGMPAGSPGMEGPKSDPYDVLLFQRDGRHAVYARYGR
ncbi:MAG: DUF411 domain-containing protein [Betaproteobacteria bacterium]|nr:DUF411 domain-containing protein [Betaproteobacteria bacterium]